ncbi:hypothetical protein AHMF7605_22180 [Adhaeribacter arboris]|uniref:Outer membrane protein beta-barrel domain-containing protein n=1 Tax=Adhaeribacter arboris TaxID=2072846 RepID=A0A2T2YKH7_9BACT|nr:outer membrane beta-barrel protein [Adhaeribacter arboris]PSR56012.1 hypothetical protein AHMF7605_22180 [Adhaeribacter arboris]
MKLLLKNINQSFRLLVCGSEYLLLIVLLLPASTALGQQIEYSGQINSGLSWFGGRSAANSSKIVLNDINVPNYTNHPYGKKPGISYGALVQAQIITNHKIVFGVQTGYEVLKSKIDIDGFFSSNYRLSTFTGGETVLRNNFINFQPFFGYRVKQNNWTLDITAGPEFGLFLKSHEKGFATEAGGYKYTTDLKRTHPVMDWRACLNATAYYRKIGVSLGYAHGLSNYQANLEGADYETYSRITRFGIIYRFN